MITHHALKVRVSHRAFVGKLQETVREQLVAAIEGLGVVAGANDRKEREQDGLHSAIHRVALSALPAEANFAKLHKSSLPSEAQIAPYFRALTTSSRWQRRPRRVGADSKPQETQHVT